MKTTASRASAVSQTRGFGDLLYDKAGARPSLDLDFAGTSSLRDKITGEYLVDHTRASNGTYIDSEGLIKQAVTNYVLYSQDLGNSWWDISGGTVTSNFAEAPDGTQTATKVTMTTGSSTYFGRANNLNTLTPGKTYTWSIWVKSTGVSSHFTIQANASGASSSQIYQLAKTPTPTEWTRYSVTFVATSATQQAVYFNNQPDDYSVEALIWGAQVNEGSEPLDYVKTTNTINSAPRFTHERVETGNLLLNSQNLHYWEVAPNSFIAGRTLAPDNTYSATVVGSNGGGSNQNIRPVKANGSTGITLKPNTTYTYSIYAKLESGSLPTAGNIIGALYGSANINFNGNLTSEWKRFSSTFTTGTSSLTQQFYTGTDPNTTAKIAFWGAQLEESDGASTYTPSIDTFTSRESNATYVDSAGLVKTSAVNKIHNSDFVNSWARDAGLSPSAHRNDVENPFGKTEFQKVLELSHSNTTAQSVWYQTGVGKGTGVLSVYAKANTWSNLNFGGQTPNQTVSFNLTNGTINSTSGTTGAIENVGNGWYRCSVNITSNTDWFIFQPHPDGATRVGARIQLVGAGSIFLYGVMFESPAPQPSDFVENLTASTVSSPRYSHDPETLTPTGLYLEPAATNIATDSNNFNTWTKHTTTTVSLANTETLSPDGTYNAWKWTGPANQNYPSIYKTYSTTNNTPHTFSLFAKAGTLDKLGLEIRGNYFAPIAIFNLTNGTVQSGTGQIKKYPNGWYRCSVTFTTDTSEVFIIRGGDGANQPGTIYIYGHQVETGNIFTSYIPTDASTVTRAADVYTSTANLTETFEPRGLLIEEARTNEATYSNIVGKAVPTWIKNGVSVSVPSNPSYTTPMGTTSDIREMAENTNNSSHDQYNNGVRLNTTAKCLTVFVKPLDDDRNIQLRATAISGNAPWATFDVNQGIVKYQSAASGTSDANIAWSMGTPFIEKHANGWYRIGLTNLAVASTNWCFGVLSVRKNASGEGDTFIGSGLGKFSLWGVQYENGSFPTSYIHNEGGSSLTRSADVASISGDNFGTYRTNLIAPSQSFVTGWDIGSLTTVTDYFAEAPDGTFTASRLVMGNTAGTYHRRTGITWDTSKTYTFSVYAKKHGTSDKLKLEIWGSANTIVHTITDEWARYELTFTPTSSSTYVGFNEPPQVGCDILIWGAQVEEGSTATNYIPSTDTFTSRLGNATYVDSNGLIKTAYRNLIHETDWTVDGTVNTWVMSNMTISTVNEINPFGLAEHVANVSGSQAGLAYQMVALTNTSNTLSVYAKANNSHQFNLISQAVDSSNKSQAATFNLTTGTVTETFNGGTGSIENVGNGWFRCVLHTTHDTNFLLLNPHNRPEGNAAYSNLGRSSQAGTTSMYFYGPQVVDNGSEAGEFHPNLTATQSAPPRYSHDPETLVPTGLYLEPARTNFFRTWGNVTTSPNIPYLTYGANGQGGQTEISTEVTAPDGTDKTLKAFWDNYGSTGHGYFRIGNSSSNTNGLGTINAGTYTFSFFVKRGNDGNHNADDILNGTYTGGNATYQVIFQDFTQSPSGASINIQREDSGRRIVKYPDGWYRVSVTFTLSQSYNFNNAGISHYTLNNASLKTYYEAMPFYYWGFQLEAGSYETSHIDQGYLSQVTRAADTYTSTATTVLDRDGGNKEAWYNHYGPQTYLLEHQRPKGAWKRIWIVGTDNNAGSFSQIATQVFWRGSAAQPERQFIVDAGTQFQFMPTLSDQTHNYKYGVAMDVNDAQAFDNGALTGTDTSVTLPTGIQTNMPDKVTIGVVGNNPTTYMSSPFARITYWKTRLPNVALIKISNK